MRACRLYLCRCRGGGRARRVYVSGVGGGGGIRSGGSR